MTNLAKLLVAGAAIGVAAPAAAQYQNYPYQQTYPQQSYPQQYQYPQQTYPQQYGQPYQGYGYQQGYNNNTVGQIIDQLLGNRYNVTDRQAVRQCASAAMAQAASQYGYGNGYGGGYNRGYSNLRVTAITDVQRRAQGLRVKGLMSSGGGYGGQYGGQYGYQNRGYGGGQLTFRCNVDYRGAVTNIRIGSYNGYRR
jgi:hypothetical protein